MKVLDAKNKPYQSGNPDGREDNQLRGYYNEAMGESSCCRCLKRQGLKFHSPCLLAVGLEWR